MVFLSADNLKMSFGENVLFDSVSFDIGDRDRVGFVGANGVGKTTLFKIITGELAADSGEIVKSKHAALGYMEQHVCSHSKRTVYSEMLSVFDNLINMENEIDTLLYEIDGKVGDINEKIRRQTQLSEEFERLGGLTYVSRTRAALTGLGFTEKEFDLPTEKLSGGQKSKLSLGKLLLSGANMLLLDEPTNHLDIGSVEWLEDFLKNFNGAAFIISHDRYFLDKVTNCTFELTNGHMNKCSGNYSYYLDKIKETREIEKKHYENSLGEIKRIEGIIAQQKQWNKEKNIKTAENKQKMLDRLREELVVPEDELEDISFEFKPSTESGNDVLICRNLSKSFGGKTLFRNADIYIKKGERVFLLGPNGCGKTTLFKMILGIYEKDGGDCKIGSNVKTGYFDQIQADLHMEKEVINEIWDVYPDMNQTDIRNSLASFLFKSDEVFKKISDLSGGERARVSLLKLMLSGANFLLLDEPTNHLDIRSREALEKALLSYDGTMFIVSHDRYFINKLADKILYLTKNGVEQYSGNYDAFIQKFVTKIEEQKEIKKPKNNNYKERKERESQKRRLEGRISRCEKEIENVENKIKKCEQELQTPDVMSDYEKITKISAELDELHGKQEKLYSDWDKMQRELENSEIQ